MIKEIFSELTYTAQDLLQTFGTFSQSQINHVPFSNSWTAGQVVEHLRKANGGINELLHGTMKPAMRTPDEMVQQIKTDFLDFNCKLQSPAILIPKNSNYDKETQLQAMDKIFIKLNEAANRLDLSQINTDFAFPVYGELSRLELIYFAIYHTQRHTHQLKNIFLRLNNAS